MASIDTMTDQIRALREKTGAGMMDCKQALKESGGDFNKALEILRKKGLADAAKRSGRTTREGLIAAWTSPDYAQGGMIELNCETDFVARTEEFQALAQALASAVGQGSLTEVEAAKERIQPAASALGENISLRRLQRFTLEGSGRLAYYVHTAGGKKGALLELSCPSSSAASHEATVTLAKELVLQIVAMSPRWISRSQIPEVELAKERDIYAAVLRQEGKPEAAIAKIVEGKLNKLFFQAFCLLDQLSIRDNKTPISQLIAEASKAAGAALTVRRFVRYQVGGD